MGSMVLDAGQQQEIRATLQRLLDSVAFRRSDQLKKLVSYLCESELRGQRQRLDEYHIGVEALGRPADFSPERDSSVRTRTHALRHKLSEYYAAEGSGERLRIEVPKGSYVPVFHDADTRKAEAPPILPAPASLLWYSVTALALVLFALASALLSGWLVPGPTLTTASILREFWQPMLGSGKGVVVCVAQPVHVWIRDYGAATEPSLQNPPLPDDPPSSAAFQNYYRARTGHPPGPNIVLHPSPNAPLWGDAAGASAAIRFLAQQGVSTDLLPESTLRNSYPLNSRNAVVFGREEFSGIVREMTPPGGFHSRYLPDERRHAIIHDRDAKRRFLNSIPGDEENFGLITILRPGVPNGEMRVVFSGVTSDGALAGIEFLTSASGLEQARRSLGGTWPQRFQIVVRTRSINGYPVKTEYAAHHIY